MGSEMCIRDSHRGVAPPPAVAEQVIARFQNNDVQTGGSGQSITDDSLTRQHVERALAAVPVRGVPGSVVLDSVNGAGCEGGRELFASLGVPYEHLYGEPHGVFARPAEPIPAHLGDLCDRVRDSDAVVGFAQDPDADRLVLVDERGVPIHEECTLALAATWVLRHRGPGVLVANLSTSRMIDRIAEGFSGAKVVRSAVGEANVVDVMEPVSYTHLRAHETS